MKDNNKDKKRKRSIVGWIIVILLAFLALVGFFAMSLSVTCSYFSPEKYVWLSFFGLTFWIILFFNLAVLLLLLIMRSRWALLPAFALMMAIPGFIRSYSFGKLHEGGDLRVMSYNVLNFKNQDDAEMKMETVADSIVEMVKKYDPDVLCVQEFTAYNTKKGRNKCIKDFGKKLEMNYQHYNTKANFGNNVIFSKYPLSGIEEDIPLATENDYGTVAKVDAGEKGVFYVMCCHLTSFQLTNDEVAVLSEPGNSKEQVREHGNTIVQKMSTAYVKRSEEVARMLKDLPYDGRPILLCGDFNDTPMSYTYQCIRKAGFTDSFVKTGRGIGYTYAGKLPLLRIDYVWTNKQIQPMSFERIKYKGSDHYPVILEFNVITLDTSAVTSNLNVEDGL